MYDYCIVGGGIVGLATALTITRNRPGARLLVIEKEDALGQHQTGHNSGVIHAGIYYAPKSFKAELCRAGERATKNFCEENGIPYRTPGKLVVATSEVEMMRLAALEANAAANGISCTRIGAEALTEMEPAVTGFGAILVPQSGIVDYTAICRAMAGLIRENGGEIATGVAVDRFEDRADHVRIIAGDTAFEARQAVACAGLQADRLASRSGLDADFRIVPFRGEYYALRPELSGLVERMIYPVPDPALPFLGIHLTPMIDGSLTVGPNAVLGMAREGYPKFSVNAADMSSYLRFPGFWKLIAANLASGIGEMKDSLFRRAYLEKCRKYCPSLQLEDLRPYRAGIRAQAVSREGKLIHDFTVLRSRRVLHVCNAPSPAATSALPIGGMIYDRLHAAD
ncbi:L-2-hydroxyglutarate oxidase [Hoeflea olei]|uniref:Hydroxyglutarate oxidase n=1 Tax=Hoeflea olei TaxID=1480615 RepID=A0A1C1YY29_9HYPH|nr:L-2-hydroxyglutarate oxidase [Hoeflea olei]OCW58375.1 hydroxyglutarate oxidase [Hoeflea olei]